MPPRPSTSYGRMCRASVDNDDDADSSGGSRGRPQSHTSPRGDKASTYAEKETAKSLFRPNSSRARHRSSSGSPDNIDCQVFADVNDAGDNSDQRNTRAEIGRNCRQNVEISVARRRHVSSDSFSFRSATSRAEDYALREKKIAELYRLKHPSKKTYRLKPLKMKDRPLRSASEGDAETIFDEIITFNRDPRRGDAVQNLTMGKSSPLGKLGRKTTDGVSNQPLVNSVGELVEPAGSDNNIFTRNSVDSVSLCMRRDESNNRSDVAGYHANETLLGLRDLPVERPAKLCQLSKESKAALISNGDNNSSANNNHGSRSALLSTDAEADERISLTDAQKDSCKNFSQGLHSHDLDLENSARKEDFSLLSSPAPPREQPPPQRLSKLHTRRLFRDRGNDGILPSYPVITANGKTLRTSSSKDSDSSEPSTPTSPHDFVMESKLERSGSQKNRGTPFASNPPPQRPDSAASSRPGSALADRPRTGQGSRSGSGREGQRPARSIAQLKKLSSQEMDDLKDGRRSQLLRAQSLPEGGMEPEKNKQSLSEMMEDIKECRYIRRQDSKE
ncbi:uncharacterized protein [Ptychodera flava]|uniref:uncharacterized protein n=1 Tax=Ptychodera flava TaxID=63121 RepID=UPI003969BFD5